MADLRIEAFLDQLPTDHRTVAEGMKALLAGIGQRGVFDDLRSAGAPDTEIVRAYETTRRVVNVLRQQAEEMRAAAALWRARNDADRLERKGDQLLAGVAKDPAKAKIQLLKAMESGREIGPALWSTSDSGFNPPGLFARARSWLDSASASTPFWRRGQAQALSAQGAFEETVRRVVRLYGLALEAEQARHEERFEETKAALVDLAIARIDLKGMESEVRPHQLAAEAETRRVERDRKARLAELRRETPAAQAPANQAQEPRRRTGGQRQR